jgi:5-oxoprolinase (ATP-hydrolysing) subunit A
MVHEVFADRAYEDDGSLVSRRKPGAVLHDAKTIADRVARMVQDGAVVSVTGKVIKMRTDTVCIHGDTPGAVDIARGVRQALKDAGIDVAPFKKAN